MVLILSNITLHTNFSGFLFGPINKNSILCQFVKVTNSFLFDHWSQFPLICPIIHWFIYLVWKMQSPIMIYVFMSDFLLQKVLDSFTLEHKGKLLRKCLVGKQRSEASSYAEWAQIYRYIKPATRLSTFHTRKQSIVWQCAMVDRRISWEAFPHLSTPVQSLQEVEIIRSIIILVI